MEEEIKTTGQKIDDIYNTFAKVEKEEEKKKKIKLSRKAKVRKRKIKKGWMGVLVIDENGNIHGEKQKVAGFSYNTKDGLYHASDGREILFWEGKFPVILQPTWKNNPILIRKDNDKNETYGQPYIKAKMLADLIKVKSGGGKIIIWILIIGALGYGAYYLLTKGNVI